MMSARVMTWTATGVSGLVAAQQVDLCRAHSAQAQALPTGERLPHGLPTPVAVSHGLHSGLCQWCDAMGRTTPPRVAVEWDTGRGAEHNVTVYDGEMRYWARVPTDWTAEQVAREFARDYDVSVMQESDRYTGMSTRDCRDVVASECSVDWL